jgi:HEPN domain-containing protein
VPSQLEEWIAKAEADAEVAHELLNLHNENISDAVCFHCQQAVEKYLKALFLLVVTTEPPKTHDLVLLLQEIRPHYPDLPDYSEEATLLTHYAVTNRYPGITATYEEAAQAVETLDAFLVSLRSCARRPLVV